MVRNHEKKEALIQNDIGQSHSVKRLWKRSHSRVLNGNQARFSSQVTKLTPSDSSLSSSLPVWKVNKDMLISLWNCKELVFSKAKNHFPPRSSSTVLNCLPTSNEVNVNLCVVCEDTCRLSFFFTLILEQSPHTIRAQLRLSKMAICHGSSCQVLKYLHQIKSQPTSNEQGGTGHF